MHVVPDAASLRHQVDQLGRRLSLLVQRELAHRRQHVEGLARHPALRRPELALRPLHERIERAARQIAAGAPRRVAEGRRRLEAIDRQLRAVGPANVLRRGYSYTLGPTGQVLRRPEEVQPGDQITTVLETGRLQSRVQGDGAGDDSPAPRRKPTAKRNRKRKSTANDEAADQGSLFG
jgi:exodeoxyribonuclease VII large subunit